MFCFLIEIHTILLKCYILISISLFKSFLLPFSSSSLHITFRIMIHLRTQGERKNNKMILSKKSWHFRIPLSSLLPRDDRQTGPAGLVSADHGRVPRPPPWPGGHIIGVRRGHLRQHQRPGQGHRGRGGRDGVRHQEPGQQPPGEY